MTTILETKRLILRAWTLDDAESMFEICRDAEVMLHIGTGKPYQTVDEARRILDWLVAYQAENGFCRWAVIEKASERVIGSCGFARLRGRSEIDLGYLFDRQVWGKGYATEAAGACLQYGFEKLKFAEVIALTDPDHTASQRVLEKIGFKCQGIKVYVNDDEDMAYLAVNPER
jgi:RimJ/RimL family protein N-acetyltransferase